MLQNQRSPLVVRNDNPGPGTYTIKDSNEGPHISLKGRPKTPDPGTASPGPAAYNPDYNVVQRNPGAPTMHMRPKDRSIEVTPGPSDYAISRDLGGQQSTMHIRPQEIAGESGPGPGQYSPKAPATGTSYTMKGRITVTERPNTAPHRDLPTSRREDKVKNDNHPEMHRYRYLHLLLSEKSHKRSNTADRYLEI